MGYAHGERREALADVFARGGYEERSRARARAGEEKTHGRKGDVLVWAAS
jgi:hypothetical protein